MKKIFFFLAILFSVVAVAQTSLGVGKFVANYTGNINDTVTIYRTSINIPITVDGNNGLALYYDFKYKITKGTVLLGANRASGTGNVVVKLQGKKFADDTYTDITSKTYAVTGTSTDTTFTVSVTTAVQWNYYNVNISTASSTITYPEYIKAYFKR